ncbi:MAG: hypothetical protein GF410_01845 [Chitinivibrionales bacterium]|nr:hypothetical protein [Chitinivibrionales bacterium]
MVKGLVYQTIVQFPPGPSGLVGVKILDAGVQVWPRTDGEYFVADNYTFEIEDFVWKQTEPWIYDIWTYNTDTEYDHTVAVGVAMAGRDEFISHFLPGLSFAEVLEVIAAAREEARAPTREERIAAHEETRRKIAEAKEEPEPEAPESPFGDFFEGEE